jgi:hypothetical protein
MTGPPASDTMIATEALRGRSNSTSLSRGQTSHRSISPWSDASSSDSICDPEAQSASSKTPLSEAMNSTELILDQLAKLAVAIRKSGAHARLQRADRSLELDQHKALRDHLAIIVLSRPTKMGNPGGQLELNLLGGVQRRLIEANLRRRNRFLYAQRHSRRIGVVKALNEPIDLAVEQSATIEGTKAAEAPPEEPIPSRKLIEKARGRRTPHAVQTVTSTAASAAEGSIALPQKQTPSQGAMSQLSSIGSKIVYPHPPRLKKGVNIFKCPCCCQSLPTMFAKGGRWKYVFSILENNFMILR